jgi:hypothetical protein
MKDLFYLYAFLIAFIVIVLLKNDIKEIDPTLSSLISGKLYLKIYALISIGVIHFIWLFLTFMANYKGDSFIYGIPCYLLISYILLACSYFPTSEYDQLNDVSKYINQLLNKFIILYFICILVVIILPNTFKKNIVAFIERYLQYYIFSK